MRQALSGAMLSAVQGASNRSFADRSRGERGARGDSAGRQGDVQTTSRSDSLSGRELAVLEELAKGTSTEDIGSKFHVSPHTVRTHIKNIMRKLDAHTRAHAVAIAYSEDAIDPDVTSE
jgi:DNA-binding CsgD family transcriptional regulator